MKKVGSTRTVEYCAVFVLKFIALMCVGTGPSLLRDFYGRMGTDGEVKNKNSPLIHYRWGAGSVEGYLVNSLVPDPGWNDSQGPASFLE